MREPIIIQDDTDYGQVTVRINGGGVCRRQTLRGSKIKTKRQFRVRAGQLIMSRIDARNGAFGLIPPELDGAIVTNDFPVFKVRKERMTPDYLRLVVSTPQFRDYCQTLSKGTTNRQRMDEETFLSIPIPFPDIPEQTMLVSKFHAAIAKAEAAEVQAGEAERKAIQFLETSLGFQPRVAKTNIAVGKLHFTRFATLERWDLIIQTEPVSTKYPLVELGSITRTISTGTTPPTVRKDYFNGKVAFFTPSDLGSDPVLVRSSRNISELAIIEKKARVFIKDTLLFVGIGSSVGKVGIVGLESATANQQITGVSIDSTKANAHFIHAWLDANKDLSTREMAQTTLPIINQERILRIPVPLPPLPEQARIVAELDRLRSEARNARVSALASRESADRNFQASLFKIA